MLRFVLGLLYLPKDIFACLFSIHNTISLSCLKKGVSVEVDFLHTDKH